MILQNSVNYDVLTPVHFLRRSVSVYPEKTAVVFYGDLRCTYREFETRVHRLAAELISIGVGKGDKVAFMCPNIPPCWKPISRCPGTAQPSVKL